MGAHRLYDNSLFHYLRFHQYINFQYRPVQRIVHRHIDQRGTSGMMTVRTQRSRTRCICTPPLGYTRSI